VIKLIKSLPRRSAKGLDGLCDRLARLARDTRANVVVFMAIGLLALGTATGVGIDFARGLNFKSALQGAADSAAIAGAALYLNNGYASQATTAATDYFTNATANLPTNNGVTSSIVVSSSAPWTVTVNASASIKSSFNGVFENTSPVSLSATAKGPTNPNIDFYLLLDSSPSMAIAATQAGINTMVANTSSQGGCAFGCHQSDPSADNLGNQAVVNNGSTCTPAGEDNYTLARCLNVTLRIDNLVLATQNLMTTAQSTMSSTSAVYRVAIYTFDIAFNTIQTLTGNMSTAQTSAGNITMLEVYKNNWLTSSNNNSDADTNYDNAMTNINSTMPSPGNGTTAKGDTPQEVLFFVTDGVEDEMVSGSRQQSLMNTSWCNTIKNRGIRIAVLYTVYYPLPTNSWYNTYISPFQSNIGPNLQACASPQLYFAVNTGGDISAAMTALFKSAVNSAYVSQ
jgi:Flp pilus assembly protein TadG